MIRNDQTQQLEERDPEDQTHEEYLETLLDDMDVNLFLLEFSPFA
jgi:hypothetical protein